MTATLSLFRKKDGKDLTHMNYIIFYLEWNQYPGKKENAEPRLPFEIIEIGAVRLDETLQETGQFHCVIRPFVYPTLHSHTRELITLDENDLQNGRPFPEAIREFFSFCGKDPVFCTWGSSDLTELQRNLNYYGLLPLLPGPVAYYDIQKLFSICHDLPNSQKSLEYAVEFLNLEASMAFHHALSDARYTAMIFCRIPGTLLPANGSLDTWQNPKTRKEEIHLEGDGYSRYISREFSSKEEAMKDREVSSSRCCLCHKAARKKIRWFSVGSKNYYCAAFCQEHGYLKGKIRMKHTDDGKFYVTKTLRMSSPQEIALIREKKGSHPQ